MKQVHRIKGVSPFHKLFQNILVLFSVKLTEYRYNYLFTHENRTTTLRSGTNTSLVLVVYDVSAVLEGKDRYYF